MFYKNHIIVRKKTCHESVKKHGYNMKSSDSRTSFLTIYIYFVYLVITVFPMLL